jgi:hypothetical protein
MLAVSFVFSLLSFRAMEAKASPAQNVQSTTSSLNQDTVIGFALYCPVARNCADTEPGIVFFDNCSSYKNCAVGEMYVSGLAGDSGAIGFEFSFIAAKTSKGRTLWVNFRVPTYMTCTFTDMKGRSDTVSGTTIKKADYLNCHWYGSEKLPGMVSVLNKGFGAIEHRIMFVI